MRSVTRRVRSRDDETRAGMEKALTAAMERLLASGRSFTSVSVEQLANEAGLARSTFYLHFRDKGELVGSLMRQVTAEIVDAAGVWFERPETARREDLEAAIRGIAEVYERHRAVMHAVVETSAYDPAVAAIFYGMMEQLVGESRRAVKRAGRKQSADFPEIADALTWMVERCCHVVLAGRKPAERERVIAALVHIGWNSIYAPR